VAQPPVKEPHLADEGDEPSRQSTGRVADLNGTVDDFDRPTRQRPDLSTWVVSGAGVVAAVVALVQFATESVIGVLVFATVTAGTGVATGYFAWQNRRPAAAVVGVVLAMAGTGIASATLSRVGDRPVRPAASGSTTTGPRLPGGTGSGAPTHIALRLSADYRPRAAWSVAAGAQSEDGDFVIECRKKRQVSEGCVFGEPPQYRLVSSVGVAEATTTSVGNRMGCAGVQGQPGFLPITQGGHYCVRTPQNIISVTVEDLPEPSSAIEVTLSVTVWPV
jgi:hypothetical protein